MDNVRIGQLIKDGKLRKRKTDKPRVKSLLDSARKTSKFVEGMRVTDQGATVIFREFYECIRQVGDALWWTLGYEVTGSHEVSMEILRYADIKEKVKLHKLDWFRRWKQLE